jgi:peptide methionine sulfoxide reductase MsrB
MKDEGREIKSEHGWPSAIRLRFWRSAIKKRSTKLHEKSRKEVRVPSCVSWIVFVV